MINGVSFGAISTDPTTKLQDSTITQAQMGAQAAPSKPSAAAEVHGDKFEKKKGKGGKVVVGLIATAATILAGLAIAVHTHVLKPSTKDATKILAKIQNTAFDIGEKVEAKAIQIAKRLQGMLKKGAEETEKAGA